MTSHNAKNHFRPHIHIDSLGNPSKDRQRFVDAIVLIYDSDWSKGLSNFENIVNTPFEFVLRTSNDARFCQTVEVVHQKSALTKI